MKKAKRLYGNKIWLGNDGSEAVREHIQKQIRKLFDKYGDEFELDDLCLMVIREVNFVAVMDKVAKYGPK